MLKLGLLYGWNPAGTTPQEESDDELDEEEWENEEWDEEVEDAEIEDEERDDEAPCEEGPSDHEPVPVKQDVSAEQPSVNEEEAVEEELRPPVFWRTRATGNSRVDRIIARCRRDDEFCFRWPAVFTPRELPLANACACPLRMRRGWPMPWSVPCPTSRTRTSRRRNL